MSSAYYRTLKTKSSAKIISLENFCKNYKSTSIISYARASRYYTDWRRYLGQQHDTIENAMSKHKRSVHRKYDDVSPGYNIERRQLQKAVELSRKTKYPIVVQDIDRLLRHKNFHPINSPYLKPTKKQKKRFLSHYHDVTFVVIDRTEDIKKNKTVRGQKFKKNKGGGDHVSGYRKRRKAQCMPKAVEMRAKGYSYRRISKRLGIAISTLHMWCTDSE